MSDATNRREIIHAHLNLIFTIHPLPSSIVLNSSMINFPFNFTVYIYNVV